MEDRALIASPYDRNWKGLKSGTLAVPTPFHGHEGVWKRVAKRLGIDYGKGVQQRPPVIGGRRRLTSHRPITTWRLPSRRGHLTLTYDMMEAKTWNRLKGKRHPSMPRIKDVFEVRLKDKETFWAIHHEALTWPPESDWMLFVDTFFRWRATAKDALKPAKQSDLKEFMEWILVPKTADPKAQKRRRMEAVLPFATNKKRDDKISRVRKALWEDPDLQKKIKWAKSTLRFLQQNSIKHRDLDPSNMGKTPRGRTVIMNLAESRSQGKKIGRIGRVGAVSAAHSESDLGPNVPTTLLYTIRACLSLIDKDARPVQSVHLLSGSGRRTYGLIHLDRYMRAAVLEAAYDVGYSPATLRKGMKKFKKFAEAHGEKAWDLYVAVANKLVA